MEKLLYLINYLAKENKINIGELPSNEIELKNLFRSLMNMCPPNDISEDYLKIEDEFLQEELDKKLITNIENLKPIKNNLYLWKGDITALKIDAIVNAANSAMLGCFYLDVSIRCINVLITRFIAPLEQDSGYFAEIL